MKKRINPCFAIGAISCVAIMLFVSMKQKKTDPRLVQIINKFNKYCTAFPRQKIFIHTDKTTYAAGENIWLKAYLVEYSYHKADTLSRNIYVQLINSNNQPVMSHRLKVKNGMAHTGLYLSDSIPDGRYQIRAYTNWMRNFGKDYYSMNYIKIKNENKTLFSKKDYIRYKAENRKYERNSKKFDLQFFPEGGDLVEGLKSTVGFKAIDLTGKGIRVEGKIHDNKNNKIADFKSNHLGMGTFELTPGKGKQYSAIIYDQNEKKKKFRLPEVKRNGTVIAMNNSFKDSINVSITSNKPASNDPAVNQYILIGQVRGRIYFSEIITLENNKITFTIPKYKFPTGIIHFTLFDSKSLPLNERLVFVNHLDQIIVTLNDLKKKYNIGDTINFSLLCRGKDKLPLNAALSVSVTNKTDSTEYDRNHASICSQLLLTSDLKGYIEQPDYYFTGNRDNTSKALDCLLLTQGWRRFRWNDILEEKYPEIQYPVEDHISLSGKYMAGSGHSSSNRPVSLSVMNEYNGIWLVNTDNTGRFKFSGLDYPSKVQVRIEPQHKIKGSVLMLDEIFETAKTFHRYNDVSSELINSKGKYCEISKKNTYKGTSIMVDNSETVGTYYGDADFVLKMNEHEMSGFSNMYDVIKGKIPGVNVVNETIVIRGVKTFMGGTDPLLLIDGIPTDISSLSAINPIDVDRVEVLKGASTSMFGCRGANGVIAVFSKRGNFSGREFLEFELTGYSEAKQFYRPKYTVKDISNKHRGTFYWNPDITTCKDSVVSISFKCPEVVASYHVVIQGISDKGFPGFITREFSVVSTDTTK